MSTKLDPDAYLDDDFDPTLTPQRQANRRRHPGRRYLPEGKAERTKYVAGMIEVAEKVEIDLQQNFTPSLGAKTHELFWLMNYLEEFYNNQLITDVLWKVKGGKEANVYCCKAHPSTGLDLVAAKIYRPRMFRNLRNDARYRQGREVRDENGKVTRRSRELLAVRKNTRFGQELRHISWLENEFQTLELLYKAGADVPKPLAHGSNVIMMEYIGGAAEPAPTLSHVSLKKVEARAIFDRLVENLSIMLDQHRVHADFSAYNVLYWAGDFTIIDFPQAVDPRRNPDGADLFVRDVERLCQYFNRYGIRQDAHSLANALWGRFQLENALDGSAIVSEEGDEDEEPVG
jgi:RIO kinase 1